MPAYCVVVKCNTNASRDDKIRFFRIPSAIGKSRKVCKISQRRKEAWIRAIKREDWSNNLTKYGRVCLRHFHSGQPASLTNETHPDLVPSLHMGYESYQSSSTCKCNRYNRLQNRLQIAIPSTSLRDDSNFSESEKQDTESQNSVLSLSTGR